MAKKCIRLYVGDDGEPRDIGEPCKVDHGAQMPTHNRQLSPPKYALHLALGYFTAATVLPAIGGWRPKDSDTPIVEASFVVEIITADTTGWEMALQLAEDLRVGLGQEAVLAVNQAVVDSEFVEAPVDIVIE